MFEKNYYTLRGIADELNIGESTIQYWQDQYDSWIPCKVNEKEKWYPRQAVGVLRFIMESADSGMTEGDIEKNLSARFPVVKDFLKQEAPLNSYERGLQVTSEDSAFGALKGLIEGLSGQQMRIADAQERRAAAEERKAVAMEKRAEAQKLMADALNNVASALKYITTRGSKGDAWSITELSNSRNKEVLPELIAESQEIFTQDKNDQEMQEKVLDSLLNEIPEGDRSSDFPDVKDLNEFLKDSSEKISPHMEDLTDLLESVSVEASPELDDLSELMDQPSEEKATDMDDLTDLLESVSVEAAPELDDLSGLVDQPSKEKAPDIDDLTDLLEVNPEKGKQTTLSSKEQIKKLPGDYKSKIIALIIQLKENKGMGVDDITEYMNKKGYKTISGKGKWNSRTIDQIFEHIKLVRSGNE